MKKIIRRFRRWNEWRRRVVNCSPFYKIFVLLGITQSPTFQVELLRDDIEEIIAKIAEEDRNSEKHKN